MRCTRIIDNAQNIVPIIRRLIAAVFLLIPGLPLIQVMFSAQVINGLLLPVILVFVMLLAGDKRLMGELVSGRINLALGWTVTGLLVLMSVVLVLTSISG